MKITHFNNPLSFDALSPGTPANIRMYLILESLTYILLLTVRVYLHSNFSGKLRNMIFFHKSAFRPFKVIQGH